MPAVSRAFPVYSIENFLPNFCFFCYYIFQFYFIFIRKFYYTGWKINVLWCDDDGFCNDTHPHTISTDIDLSYLICKCVFLQNLIHTHRRHVTLILWVTEKYRKQANGTMYICCCCFFYFHFHIKCKNVDGIVSYVATVFNTMYVTGFYAKLVTQNTVIYCDDSVFASWYADI